MFFEQVFFEQPRVVIFYFSVIEDKAALADSHPVVKAKEVRDDFLRTLAQAHRDEIFRINREKLFILTLQLFTPLLTQFLELDPKSN